MWCVGTSAQFGSTLTFGDLAALEGFVCPQSSAEVLENMARHALETGQGAFTWTGPYGGGKSSLAVVLGAMLYGKGDLRNEAQSIVGERVSSLLLKAFPPRSRGWTCAARGWPARPSYPSHRRSHHSCRPVKERQCAVGLV